MTTSMRIGFVSLAMWLSPLVAQNQGPATADAGEAPDVPGRGVARISLLNGDVTVRRGDSGDAIAAAINAPVVAADHLLTGPMSRTELHSVCSRVSCLTAGLKYHAMRPLVTMLSQRCVLRS